MYAFLPAFHAIPNACLCVRPANMTRLRAHKYLNPPDTRCCCFFLALSLSLFFLLLHWPTMQRLVYTSFTRFLFAFQFSVVPIFLVFQCWIRWSVSPGVFVYGTRAPRTTYFQCVFSTEFMILYDMCVIRHKLPATQIQYLFACVHTASLHFSAVPGVVVAVIHVFVLSTHCAHCIFIESIYQMHSMHATHKTWAPAQKKKNDTLIAMIYGECTQMTTTAGAKTTTRPTKKYSVFLKNNKIAHGSIV